jgi:hypothetical protein
VVICVSVTPGSDLNISLGNTEAFELLGRMEFCVVGVMVFSVCRTFLRFEVSSFVWTESYHSLL